jgi:nucleotide-binding universal stress UspA family protein
MTPDIEPTDLFKHILVAVDSEGLAANAAVLGFQLADRLSSKLDLIHAVGIPAPLWPGIGELELTEMHATALAAARAKTLAALGPELRDAGVGARLDELLRVAPGHPAKVILERLEEFGSDLLILGPHASPSLFDFGSTARAILSRVATPVWIQEQPVSPVRSILVPVDFSQNSRKAVQYAHALARRLGASLRMLHCYEPPGFAYTSGDAAAGPTYVVEEERRAVQAELERWSSASEWGSLPIESSFVDGAPVKTILTLAEQHDLIVMGTHGRTGLARFLIGSVAYGVLKQSRKPVLVIPIPARTWLLGRRKFGRAAHKAT